MTSRLPSPSDGVFVSIETPKTARAAYVDVEDGPVSSAGLQGTRLLYTSAVLALFQTMQFGWSLQQINLSAFNDKKACDARPVVPGTCLMFPGHTKTQWTLVVNAWVVGGMIGALTSGKLSDRLGRKTTLRLNCLTMTIGSIVQASASSIAMFAVGRGIAGLASGVTTALANGYISEIAPPHLRSKLGVGYQIAVAGSCLILSIVFFVADTASGWRYIAAVPTLIALGFTLASPRYMVESPAWLLTKGRHEDAEEEIAKLFGLENVPLALAWMQKRHRPRVDVVVESSSSKKPMDDNAQISKPNPWRTMVSAKYRRQTLIAAFMALALQFSGINAVNFYSSGLFKNAGLADVRVGILVVNIVNLTPSIGAGYLAARFGNKTMLLAGQLFMLLCAVGLTIVLVAGVGAMSVVFVALYIGAFGMSLGSLAFVVANEVFPDELRASGGALTLFTNWCGTLIIGVGYPYVADALGDLGFVPFIGTVSFFVLFMYKFLPETKGKTTDEIQALFHKN